MRLEIASNSETVYNPRSGQISSLDRLRTIDRGKKPGTKFPSQVTRLTLFLLSQQVSFASS